MEEARVNWLRRSATVAVLLALISPAIRNDDGLPLSTYPMYASARSEVTSFITASGIESSGERTALSALTISGSRDRLIAQSFLNDAVRRGDAQVACREIARRVDREGIQSVEIARERHDTVARLRTGASLLERTVLTQCEVGA